MKPDEVSKNKREQTFKMLPLTKGTPYAREQLFLCVLAFSWKRRNGPRIVRVHLGLAKLRTRRGSGTESHTRIWEESSPSCANANGDAFLVNYAWARSSV